MRKLFCCLLFLPLFLGFGYFSQSAMAKEDCGYTKLLDGSIVKHGHCKEYFGDGSLKFDWIYVDGLLDGVTKEYYQSGRLKSVAPFKGDKYVDCTELYYESGTLKQKECYRNGELNGIVEWYYPSGRLWRRANFKDGRQDGVAEQFYENGKLQERKYFKDGRKEGERTIYYDSSTVKSRQTYSGGRSIGSPTVYPERNENEEDQQRTVAKQNISYDQAMSGLSHKFIMQKKEAVNGEERHVGSASKGLIYLELTSRENNIVKGSLLVTTPNDASDSDIKESSDIILQFLMNFFSDSQNSLAVWVYDSMQKMHKSGSWREEKDINDKRISIGHMQWEGKSVGIIITVANFSEIKEKAAIEKASAEKFFDTIYLANGQFMECYIIERNDKGVWVEIDGLKVFFSNQEIKYIKPRSK